GGHRPGRRHVRPHHRHRAGRAWPVLARHARRDRAHPGVGARRRPGRGSGMSESRESLAAKTALVTGAARGIGFAIAARLASEEAWRRVIDADLTSVFLCCRAAVPVMLEQRSGRIINIASIAGKEGNPTLVPYSAAKAGVIGLTKALAKEVCTRGILVHAVAPAVIGTELLQQMEKSTVDLLVSKIPMGRVGRPEEVAALAAWLASDDCSFTTGAVHDLSGGRATY